MCYNLKDEYKLQLTTRQLNYSLLFYNDNNNLKHMFLISL